jgi:hypothetical protein
MSDFADLFAPPGGWRVRIRDHSGGAEDGIVEEIGGFATLMQANAFARAYVRDSIERCREAGASGAGAVLAAWRAFGEDAEIVAAGEGGWRSEHECADFAAEPASAAARDWRALDPRQDHDDDDDDDVGGGGA